MGTVKIRRNKGLAGLYSWRTEVQLEEREREMADLRNGLRCPWLWASSQLGDCSPASCWQQGTWWPGGQRELLPEMGAVLGMKEVLLESHRVCKDGQNSETPSKKATLLGICDNKLSWKAGNFTLVQRNISKTVVAVVYLPFLTYRMRTVVQPHRDCVWFKGPVWYMCMILGCSRWPECKVHLLIRMTNVV